MNIFTVAVLKPLLQTQLMSAIDLSTEFSQSCRSVPYIWHPWSTLQPCRGCSPEVAPGGSLPGTGAQGEVSLAFIVALGPSFVKEGTYLQIESWVSLESCGTGPPVTTGHVTDTAVTAVILRL